MKTEVQKKYLPLLRLIKKLKGPEISELIMHLDDNSIDHLCEACYNLLYNDMNLTKQKKTRLKRYIKSNCSIHRLKQISTKNVPISKRRRCLSQEGKGLPLLLASVIPFITDLIFGKK
jgi:hypothetical protein